MEVFVEKQKKLNNESFTNIANYTHNEVEKRFERLEFTTFDYIKVDPPAWTIILAYVFTILVCVGISLFSIKNEYDNEN